MEVFVSWKQIITSLKSFDLVLMKIFTSYVLNKYKFFDDQDPQKRMTA